MLSALIPSIHSYPAIHLVAKPADQRYVQPSPLVLRPTPLKHVTPTADRDRPVSRRSDNVPLISKSIRLYLFRLFHGRRNWRFSKRVNFPPFRSDRLRRSSRYGDTQSFSFGWNPRLWSSHDIILLVQSEDFIVMSQFTVPFIFQRFRTASRVKDC